MLLLYRISVRQSLGRQRCFVSFVAVLHNHQSSVTRPLMTEVCMISTYLNQSANLFCLMSLKTVRCSSHVHTSDGVMAQNKTISYLTYIT